MQETIVKELEVRLFEKLSLEDIRTVSENLYLLLSEYDISKVVLIGFYESTLIDITRV